MSDKLPPGVKYDNDKPRWGLLPWKQVEHIVRVLTFGSKKYSDDNWKYVDNAKERYFDAMHRHVAAWRDGEILDPESHLPHLAHAGCCLLFIMWFEDAAANLGATKSQMIEDLNAEDKT